MKTATGYENWREDTVGYMKRAIEMGASRYASASYMRILSKEAAKEGRGDISRALFIAADYLDASDYASAAEALS